MEYGYSQNTLCLKKNIGQYPLSRSAETLPFSSDARRIMFWIFYDL